MKDFVFIIQFDILFLSDLSFVFTYRQQINQNLMENIKINIHMVLHFSSTIQNGCTFHFLAKVVNSHSLFDLKETNPDWNSLQS